MHRRGRHFLLKSRNTGLDYPGHYLSTNEDGELTVLALPSFNEEIEVTLLLAGCEQIIAGRHLTKKERERRSSLALPFSSSISFVDVICEI